MSTDSPVLNRYLLIFSLFQCSALLRITTYLFFSRDLDTFSKKHLEQSNGVNPAANKGELCFDIPSEYAIIFCSFRECIISRIKMYPGWYFSNRPFCSPFHIICFDWFLSGLWWNIVLEFCNVQRHHFYLPKEIILEYSPG